MAKTPFHVLLIKPTHYDDDGYPLQWHKSIIPSNSLASVHGLAEDFVTLGIQRRPWDTARITPGVEIFSYFSARDFVPEAWRGGYPNPAFAEMTERDGAWAARIIARFSREHLRRIVQAGNLTKPLHSTFLVETLVARQEAILRRAYSAAPR